MADESDQQIHLSGELVAKVMDLLVEHDVRCAEGLVACQYLSAVQAILICQKVPQDEARQELVNELAEFMRYAVEDMGAAQPAAPRGAAPRESSGIWKPGDP